MKKLIEQRYTIRRNLLAVIGLCLSFYFSWHAALGERGFVRLASLEHKIEKLDAEVASMQTARLALEDKVVRLRPASLDRDLLEERAREMLGFQYPEERVILN